MDQQSGPILNEQRRHLGEERLQQHFALHGALQAMTLFLVTSITTTGTSGYTDEMLACIKQDAQDLRDAANEYADFAEQLADYWRAQRTEHRTADG